MRTIVRDRGLGVSTNFSDPGLEELDLDFGRDGVRRHSIQQRQGVVVSVLDEELPGVLDLRRIARVQGDVALFTQRHRRGGPFPGGGRGAILFRRARPPMRRHDDQKNDTEPPHWGKSRTHREQVPFLGRSEEQQMIYHSAAGCAAPNPPM